MTQFRSPQAQYVPLVWSGKYILTREVLLLFVLSVRIMGSGCCFFIAVVCALSVCGKYLWKRIACFLREILTLQSNGWAHKLRFGP
jgi:hypothetical protein